MNYRNLGAAGYLLEAVVLVAYGGFTVIALPASLSTIANGTAPVTPTVATRVEGLLLPLMLLVPLVLVSLAWFSAGRSAKSGVLKATGVLGLILVAGAGLFIGYGALGPSPPQVNPGTTNNPLPGQFLGEIIGLVAVGLSLGLVAFVYIILEIVTLFVSAGIFGKKGFSRAGWGRVFSIVAVIVVWIASTIVLIASLLPRIPFNSTSFNQTSTAQPMLATNLLAQLGMEFAVVELVVLAILAVPSLLAFSAFRSLPEESPMVQQAPPVPTAG